MVGFNAFMGVDPGASGAIAVIDANSNIIGVVPASETPADISAFLDSMTRQYRLAGIIEQVSSMPRQGVASTFKFGYSYGMLTGLLVAHQVRFERVTPQVWQKTLRCMSGGDKKVTRQAAQCLWPAIKITHCTADALLIAEFCRRRNLSDTSDYSA